MSCLEPSFATNIWHVIIIHAIIFCVFRFKTEAWSTGVIEKGNARKQAITEQYSQLTELKLLCY